MEAMKPLRYDYTGSLLSEHGVSTEDLERLAPRLEEARREVLESYVRRLERLEEIAASFPGVERVFALQAGREVRVIVDPEEMDDLAAGATARQIARKLEEDLQYPGQIEVTVIREFRAKDYAR